MSEKTSITIETTIHAPVEKVWELWIEPTHITKWCYAQDDWEAPYAENDVCVGGRFKTTMSAKDKSVSFDFTGIYTKVQSHEVMEYDIDDGRHVKIQFASLPDGVKVTETFDAEEINSVDLQRTGWQAILDNFKKYVEAK